MTSKQPLPRAERRRNTETRILAAARTVFAERGFERTTIRAIAADAGVDPALVMQYFGSKQELFTQAIRGPAVHSADDAPQDLAEHLLATLGVKLGGLPETSVAMMRSMLTHPEAAAAARGMLTDQIDQIGTDIPGDDQQLRATLLMVTMLGVTIGRQLLDLDTLRDAPPDEITDLLRPCFQSLIGTPKPAV